MHQNYPGRGNRAYIYMYKAFLASWEKPAERSVLATRFMYHSNLFYFSFNKSTSNLLSMRERERERGGGGGGGGYK